MRYKWFILFSLLALLFTSNCTNDTCNAEDGKYDAIYTKLSGNCEDFTPYTVPIKYEYKQLEIFHHREVFFSNTVITQIEYKGCILGISQELQKEGKRVFSVTGDFYVENSTKLVGQFNRVQFSETGEYECNGRYNVTLVKKGEMD